MTLEVADFYEDFFQDIVTAADAEGEFAADVFFERFSEHLVDAGELDTADRVHLTSARGLRVDGYGGDPSNSGGVLSLIVSDFSQTAEIGTLTATEMDAAFRRLSNFLSKSLEPEFRESLEETAPAFGLADLLAHRWPEIVKVRMFLISNRRLSTRVDGRPAGEIDGIPVTYSVWDLNRLHRFVASGAEREEIVIDLENEYGGALAALPAHLQDAGYEAYLLVLPGSELAAIYDRWGARLLEQNVRVFLQARGNVNKGIRNTLEHDPGMFFAFNNGITATAEAAEIRQSDSGMAVTSLRNLQIVNGGQTTASIHAASRKVDVDLSKVFVQLKLSIVAPARAAQIVPLISEYANSQNKVSAADFFANHPFHVRMEEFSRRIFAPSPDGTFRESKWFYERARGQYQDARALLTVAARRKFDLEYPKTQMISKTDLAKFLNSWRGHPEMVSRGSQKNFADFAGDIGQEWLANESVFGEDFYRQSIAQAIGFRETERLVSKQDWYQGGGVRSRVVPYAISKMVHDAREDGRFTDFARIWRSQTLPGDLIEALTISAKAVHGVIVDSGAENPNPLEWAKQPACWSRVKSLPVPWPDHWLDTFLTASERADGRRAAIKDQRVLTGIEAQTVVVTKGGPFWSEAMNWGVSQGVLTQLEADILGIAAEIPSKLPSEKQSLRALDALRRLRSEGFPAEEPAR